MSMENIRFEAKGISSVLRHERLVVPPNQRDYAWEVGHVESLMGDVLEAIRERKENYFLGTIVLTRAVANVFEVADGQQRLATTLLWLAAIRDYFAAEGEKIQVERINNQFLSEIDSEDEVRVPRLSMNVADNKLFRAIIVDGHKDSVTALSGSPKSNQRLVEAADAIRKQVQEMAAFHKEMTKNRLKEVVGYLEQNAFVMVFKVPSDIDAFVMFETLNDRGLKTSQVDLLKNRLFSEAGQKHASEAQQHWAAMTARIDAIDDDDILVSFFRHLLIAKHGPTRDKEVFTKIKQMYTGASRALEFLGMSVSASSDYAAILSPDHAKWKDYPPAIRRSLETMALLRVKQIRPLMLAVARSFPPVDASRAFAMFVSWTVRFLTAGGRGGTLEEAYATSAQAVEEGKIADADGLLEKMRGVVPSDADFKTGFSVAKVSKNYLARYYLRSLESFLRNDSEPEFVPNEDTVITLEHILPENPSQDWGISRDVASAVFRRIGNMALLRASDNVLNGNELYDLKRPVLEMSNYVTTKSVPDTYATWGVEQINNRQALLAEAAVKTWPLIR